MGWGRVSSLSYLHSSKYLPQRVWTPELPTQIGSTIILESSPSLMLLEYFSGVTPPLLLSKLWLLYSPQQHYIKGSVIASPLFYKQRN